MVKQHKIEQKRKKKELLQKRNVHVTVVETATGQTFTGDNAPLLSNLVMNFLIVSLLFWCFFVAQAKMCERNEIREPAYGSVACLPQPFQQGLECAVTCSPGFRFPGGRKQKVFKCSASKPWNPQVPDCISEGTSRIGEKDGRVHLSMAN